MRLAAQFKGGFYAAPPEAVRLACEYLSPPTEPFALLDPCCGEGAALMQLATYLPSAVPWAVELSDSRARLLEAACLLPSDNLLAPCSYFDAAITAGSMGAVWCNPPFDDEIGGGGRVELSFLQNSTRHLATKGVMMFVCPEYVSDSDDIRTWLGRHFTHLARREFPADHRPFNEVIVFGVKRSTPLDTPEWIEWGPPVGPYQIPTTEGPSRFEKTGFTATDLIAAVASSPGQQLLAQKAPAPPSRPPAPLGIGHRALLLSSGQLDGIVRPEGELPHVVRGTVRKIEYVSKVEENECKDGSTSTSTTISERIELVLRAVGPDGIIVTLNQHKGDDDDSE